MGQTLSEPITTKETESCENLLYRVGSSRMQGWRTSMEDAHCQFLALPTDEGAAFFAVYDGHGGKKAAEYSAIHLHNKITESPFYASGDVSEAIRTGFLSLDQNMFDDEETKSDGSGSTAIIALIKDGKIYCGNAGDSRAVLSFRGWALPLSEDHKPTDSREQARIHSAGGWVEFGRVNGSLALSRALGDFAFKQNDSKSADEQVVTAYPDVEVCPIESDTEFVVLACDGIWDVLSNQEVVKFCRDKLASGQSPEEVCEALLDKCLSPDTELSGIGCDNMTGASLEEYQAKLTKPRGPAPPSLIEKLRRLHSAELSALYGLSSSPQELSAELETLFQKYVDVGVTIDDEDDIYVTPNESPPQAQQLLPCSSVSLTISATNAAEGQLWGEILPEPPLDVLSDDGTSEPSSEEPPPNEFSVASHNNSSNLIASESDVSDD